MKKAVSVLTSAVMTAALAASLAPVSAQNNDYSVALKQITSAGKGGSNIIVSAGTAHEVRLGIYIENDSQFGSAAISAGIDLNQAAKSAGLSLRPFANTNADTSAEIPFTTIQSPPRGTDAFANTGQYFIGANSFQWVSEGDTEWAETNRPLFETTVSIPANAAPGTYTLNFTPPPNGLAPVASYIQPGTGAIARYAQTAFRAATITVQGGAQQPIATDYSIALKQITASGKGNAAVSVTAGTAHEVRFGVYIENDSQFGSAALSAGVDLDQSAKNAGLSLRPFANTNSDTSAEIPFTTIQSPPRGADAFANTGQYFVGANSFQWLSEGDSEWAESNRTLFEVSVIVPANTAPGTYTLRFTPPPNGREPVASFIQPGTGAIARYPQTVFKTATITVQGGATGTGLRGDVNLNGRIDSNDATLILREATANQVGLSVFDTMEQGALRKQLADVDYDGRISSRDATATLRYSTLLQVRPNATWDDVLN